MRTILIAIIAVGLTITAAAADDAALAPPQGAQLLLKAIAEGVQIYGCQSQASGPAWTLTGPEAVLRDPSGKEIGKHFAGPSWQALDGSTVVGEVVSRADAPGGNAIPWLLLRAKSHEGAGQLANVAFVQRVDTKGGLAPASACDLGATPVRIPYSATYVFYTAP
jgi:hypothetical protein